MKPQPNFPSADNSPDSQQSPPRRSAEKFPFAPSRLRCSAPDRMPGDVADDACGDVYLSQGRTLA
jgi:hypothetical protein